MSEIPEGVPEFATPGEAEEVLVKLAGSLLARPLKELRSAPLTEDRYRTLLEQVQAVTFMASFDQSLADQEVYVSPQIESLLGYTQKEWLEDPTLWYARLHPEDKDRWNREFAATIVAGEAVRSVYRFLARDGRVVWILGDVRIQRDEETGLPRFIQGVGFDVSTLKETEEKLRRRTSELEVAQKERREAEESLKEIASTIRETFWVLTPSLDRILFATPAFEQVWGCAPAALQATLPAAIIAGVHPGDRERVSAAFERMKSEETEIEHRIGQPGGRVRWVRSRSFPVRGPQGVARVIAVSEDVTERKELEVQIQQAREREIIRLRSEVQKETTPERILLGSSDGMKRLRSLIRKVAPSQATVLVTGESGTGKELVARALHYGGPRAQGPFVDVNCAALPDSLVESELFGHEKGAFTGAASQHQGKFEQAHGGTLFLDEIGDMPLPVQAKILRVLEDRCFERVGGKEKTRVDVRVICATNRNLEEAILKGGFRQDLRYRFHVEIPIPALRDRASDVLELAEHFLARANRDEKRQVELSDAALQMLKGYSWRGNVRELRHAIEQAVLFCEGDRILPEDLPPAVTGGRPQPSPQARKTRLVDAVVDLERSMIVHALRESTGVKTKAARSLGTNERNLTYKMDKLGIVALHESPWVEVV